LGQLVYAHGWFSTYNVAGVRKALEDGVQVLLSGEVTPVAAIAKAQREAQQEAPAGSPRRKPIC
jgi:hypothetical protein